MGIRFLFAFITAVGLWVWRTELRLPGVQLVTVPNQIPVEVSGVPTGLIVVPQPNQSGVPQVTVQVRVPTSLVNSVSSSWFRATINVSDQKAPGTQLYRIDVVSLEPGVDFVEAIPPSLPVTLDAISTRTVPIQIQYQGLPPNGYIYSTPVLDNSTNTVTISGPQIVLQQIATVIAVVRLDNRTGNFHDVTPLVPQSASGGDVPTTDLQLSPRTVGYTETIQQPATTRTVAVIPKVTGQVAVGYVVAGITVTPPQVSLVGNPSVLDSAPAALGTDAIDVTNAPGDVTKTVAVQVPKDTSLVGDNHVQVVVAIRPIPSSAVFAVAPQVTGAGVATQVQLSVSSINITLQGAAATLQKLQPRDVGVTVNVTGLSAGQHDVTPTIDLPTGVTVQTINPSKVRVTIIPPTPTPTPTPTSTPTAVPTRTATPTPAPAGSPAPAPSATRTVSPSG